jgi:hypothetical protein
MSGEYRKYLENLFCIGVPDAVVRRACDGHPYSEIEKVFRLSPVGRMVGKAAPTVFVGTCRIIQSKPKQKTQSTIFAPFLALLFHSSTSNTIYHLFSIDLRH